MLIVNWATFHSEANQLGPILTEANKFAFGLGNVIDLEDTE